MAGSGCRRHCLLFHNDDDNPPPATLGILAFDAAKTMCRLISLYKSLTDDSIAALKNHAVKSKGVAYLNSNDESFLLNLARSERLEDLNAAIITVLHLGQRCTDTTLGSFGLIYTATATTDNLLEFKTRNVQKMIEKMEKLVSSTWNLHDAMESLSETEASEKKIQRLKSAGIQYGGAKPNNNMDNFKERIKFKQKKVRYYKEISLWNLTFDKAVHLMARIVCIIYARIFYVFRPYASDVSCFENEHMRAVFLDCCSNYMQQHRDFYLTNPNPNSCVSLFEDKKDIMQVSEMSSPTATTVAGNTVTKPGDKKLGQRNIRVFKMPEDSTVGGSGLALRYAKVILMAERCLHAPATIGEEARGTLYEMLPARVKKKVRRKLGKHWREEEGGERKMAEGWRAAVEELMEWLSPVANDTVRWQKERNMEKQRLETKPTVLLLQTLHFSDLEKAETAIVEVLVGLSCIYWYDTCRNPNNNNDPH